MTEDQIRAWQVSERSVQGRIMKRLIGYGFMNAASIGAEDATVSAVLSILRRKLAEYDIAIITARDGKRGYALSAKTRAALLAGAIRGRDAAEVARQQQVNARFTPPPGESARERTIAALKVRIARAEAGDVDAVGPDAMDEIIAEIRAAMPNVRPNTIRAYLVGQGLEQARVRVGLNYRGLTPYAAPRKVGPWRPGVDPRPAWLHSGQAA